MRRLSMVEARREFADTLTRAHYRQEVTIITKHGRDIAAVVPMEQVKPPPTLPLKKAPQRAK